MKNVNSAEVEIFSIFRSSQMATSHTRWSRLRMCSDWTGLCSDWTATVFWQKGDCVVSHWFTHAGLDCVYVLTEPRLCSHWNGTVFWLNRDCAPTEPRLCSDWIATVSCRVDSHTQDWTATALFHTVAFMTFSALAGRIRTASPTPERWRAKFFFLFFSFILIS
jgi:hypothetical protein